MPDEQPQSAPPKEEAISLQLFLERIPPGRSIRLSPTGFKEVATGTLAVSAPALSIYCSDASCKRVQFFKCWISTFKICSTEEHQFLTYSCKNCGRTHKTYALRFHFPGFDVNSLSVVKFGELPPFGPPLSPRLLQLGGTQAHLLKKGRQAENQSMGIGAFAYYRRVVEEQKSRLIDELQKAVERLGGESSVMQALEKARAESRFSEALQLMADVTPNELFLQGQNPLKLLHGPLSAGLHGGTDEECLDKAHDIRIVLAALLERIQQVTEEKSELDAAIKALLKAPADNDSGI